MRVGVDASPGCSAVPIFSPILLMPVLIFSTAFSSSLTLNMNTGSEPIIGLDDFIDTDTTPAPVQLSTSFSRLNPTSACTPSHFSHAASPSGSCSCTYLRIHLYAALKSTPVETLNSLASRG